MTNAKEVQKYLEKLGSKTSPKGIARRTMNCEECGKEFVYQFKSEERRFCSPTCYWKSSKGKKRKKYATD